MFLNSIGDSGREIGLWYVGLDTKFIRGLSNLHELHRIEVQAGNCQVVCEGEPEGGRPLFPMLFELPVDIFDVVFIHQIVPFHDCFRAPAALPACQDLLLVFQWDLGIRDKRGGGQGMGGSAFPAPDTLDTEGDQGGHEFHRTLIMPVADEASLPFTGTFYLMELEAAYGLVINILRKILAILKENRYHNHVIGREVFPFVREERAGPAVVGRVLSFYMLQTP